MKKTQSQFASKSYKEQPLSVNKEVEFFVQGLDRYNRDVKTLLHPELLDNNIENSLAKIFNCGNTGAYTGPVEEHPKVSFYF